MKYTSNILLKIHNLGLPWWLSGKEFTCQCRRHGFDPQSRKIPHATEQLSPCAITTESMLQIPGATASETRAAWSLCWAIREAHAMRSPCNEKPMHHNHRVTPVHRNYRRTHEATKTQHGHKWKFNYKIKNKNLKIHNLKKLQVE